MCGLELQKDHVHHRQQNIQQVQNARRLPHPWNKLSHIGK